MASAKNVILYTGLSNKKGQEEENCVCGLLVVTNFKLSFLTKDDDQVGSFFLFFFFSQKHLHNVFHTHLIDSTYLIDFQLFFTEYDVPGELFSTTKRCDSTEY